MSGFKLLAIRPLGGCNEKFRKNLKEGMVYKFYQDYEYYVSPDKSEIQLTNLNNEEYKNELVTRVESTGTEINLYSKDNLKINVSVVVGENGSGKSSLIDFFNLITYYISVRGLKTGISSVEKVKNKLRISLMITLEFLNNIKQELNFILDDSLSEDLENLNIKEIQLLTDEFLTKLHELNFTQVDKINNLEESLKLNLTHKLYSFIAEANEIIECDIKPNTRITTRVFYNLMTGLQDKIKEFSDQLKVEVKSDKLLDNNLAFQFFYELNINDKSNKSKIFIVTKEINKNTVEINDEEYFYSILLNYSLHSLNTNQQGLWLDSLFHKNDGYQTPLVINPYREGGKININNELKLVQNRIFHNLIDELKSKDQAKLLNKYLFKKLILKLKFNDNIRFPYSKLDFDIKDKHELISFVAKKTKESHKYEQNKDIKDYCLGYLIEKFDKIARTYMYFLFKFKNYSDNNFSKKIDEFKEWRIKKASDFILENETHHITKKFNQTYNFLNNYDKLCEKLNFIEKWNLNTEIEITIPELKLWINEIKSNYQGEISTDEIIDNMIPAIFNFDFEFDFEDKKGIFFSDMSSGEQQYIHNINNIIYHLNNLKSINPIKSPDNKSKYYQAANIILDEIELYYHPNFQKKLINDIVNTISSINFPDNFNNFNIILLTHSPFILSDIPQQNILRLENGAPSIRKFSETFGANIHDLLANDFFMQNGFMGEFAKDKINEIINKLQNNDKYTQDEQKGILKMIELVGEDILRNSLLELYRKKFDELTYNELLNFYNRNSQDGTN